MPYLILAVLTAVLIAAIVATAALRTVYDQRQQLESEDAPPSEDMFEGAQLAWGSVGLVVLAIVILALTGCDPMTPEEIAALKAAEPDHWISVFHDDHRSVTCWRDHNKGGVSCLPDWMLKPAAQEPKQ